jgi:uncharacterized protein (TIGR02001 family)
MNRISKLAAGIALATTALVSTSAVADVSYSVGWASEYYYRGILQKESSANAGVEFTEGGFTLGTWAADVGDGAEVDLYGSYTFEFDGGFWASVGATGYYYTGEFDDTYEELNFGLGIGMFSLGYSVGEYDGFGADADYDFLSLTIEAENGLYGTFGAFGDDFDGEYIEVGYGFSVAEIDFGIAAIFNSDELSDQVSSSGSPTEGEAIVFTIGKSF